jgi:hypothetical protein
MPDDPFAAIAKPIVPQPAPPAAGGAEDPFASIAKLTAAPTPPTRPHIPDENTLDGFFQKHPWIDPANWMRNLSGQNIAEGAGAGVERSAAGLTKLIRENSMSPIAQVIARGLAGKAVTREAAKPNQGVEQTAGEFGEGVGEFFTGQEFLSMLGHAGMALTAGEKLKQAQQLATTVKSIPFVGKLLHIGLRAVEAGGIGGGQTLVQTGGDVKKAKTSAEMNAATAGVLGVVGDRLATAFRKIAPRTLDIGGEEVPALATQVTEKGQPIENQAVPGTKVWDVQQDKAQNIVRNSARSALSSVLDEINSTRRLATPSVDDASRLLPAPEGSQGFTFTREGPPTTETPTGTLVQRAEAVPKTESHAGAAGISPQQGEIGPLAATVPSRALERPQAFKTASATGEELAAGEQAQSAIDQDTIERIGTKKATGKKLTPDERSQLAQAQARESTGKATTEPRGEEIGGGGQLQTKDPHQATAWMHDLEEQMADPGFSTRTPENQAYVKAQHESLQQQLGMYYNSPYANRFDPVDISKATDQVHTFGGAAEQIRNAIRPVWERLSPAAKENFDNALAEFKDAGLGLRNATGKSATEAAQNRYDEASQAVGNLIDLHRGAVSGTDYQMAKSAWGKSAKLDELHQVLNRMMNSVTPEETEQGYERVMTGQPKALQNWLDRKTGFGNTTNQQQIEKLIGADGRKNIKDIAMLLSNVKTNRGVMDLLKNVATEVGNHMRMGGVGGAVGSYIAHINGMPWYEGMAGGALLGSTMRVLLTQAAHEPAVGQLVDYAVKHNIDPKIYAPLIARTIIGPALPKPARSKTASIPQQASGGTQ